jgi:hypothetical protein
MNFRTTLILVALLIGAIIAFVTVELYSPPITPDIVDAKSQPLFTSDELPTARVQSVTLADPQSSNTAVRRVTRWWQTEPFEFPVGSSQMDRLIDEIATLRFVRRMDMDKADTPSLADAGLEPAQLVVSMQIEGSDAKPVTLRLGGRTIGARRYAQVEGRPYIYIIETDLGELDAAGVMASVRFRSPNAPSVGGAQRVTLTVRGDTLEMYRANDGWRFAPPHIGRVSDIAIRDLMTNVGSVLVQLWMPTTSDATAYGLDQPVMSLAITQAIGAESSETPQVTPSTPGATTILRIGSPVDNSGSLRYASWGEAGATTPAVFAVATSELDKFTWSAEKLRDKRLTGLRAADIVEITVESNAEATASFHAERSSSGWSFGAPQPGFPAESGAIADLVTQLTTAEAVHFADAALAAGEPIARVSLKQLGTGAVETIAVYPAPEAALPVVDELSIKAKMTYWFVRRGEEPVGCVVPQAQLDKLMQPLHTFRQRVVYEVPMRRISNVTIDQPGMGRREFIRTVPAMTDGAAMQPGEWVLRGENGYEDRSWQLLLNNLAPLRAVRWADEATLGENVTRLTLATPDRDKPVTLTLDTQSAVAKVEGTANDGTFIASPDLVATITAELRNRTVLSVGTRGIKQIDILRDGVTRTLTTDANGQFLLDGTTDGFTQQAAAAVYDQVAGLRVVRYLDDAGPASLFTVKLTIVRNDGGAPPTIGIPADSDGKVWLEGMIRGKTGEAWAMVAADLVKAAMAINAPAPE